MSGEKDYSNLVELLRYRSQHQSNRTAYTFLTELKRNYRHILAKDIAETIRWAVFYQHLIDIYAIALLKPGSIPKTSSGKIQRQTCKQKYQGGSLNILSQWRL